MGFFEEFKKIEKQISLENITVGNDQLWPIIRTKVFEEYRKISGLRSRLVKVNSKNVNVFFKTFFYGFNNLRKLIGADIWFFSASDRRKEFNGKYYDRIIEDALDLVPNPILIENPLPLGYHYNMEQIPHKTVVSQTFLFFWTLVIAQFIKKPRVENEQILINILERLSVEIDYKHIYRLYMGQYLLTKFLLNFCRPKKIVMVYTASSQGYIKAFKEKNIPVIEIQHGVINEKHVVYNVFKKFNSIYYPDFLFTFSDREKEVFKNGNFFIQPTNVKSVGYSFLEKVLCQTVITNFDRERYKKIIAFSFQEPFSDFSVDFLIKCAIRAKDILFLLVLRNEHNLNLSNFPSNLVIDPKINIYDAIKICDIHSTINSSTTIEALAFGKPSILINYEGQARAYFNNLETTPGVMMISTVDEFMDAADVICDVDVHSIKLLGQSFFKPNFYKNLKASLAQIS